MSQWCKDGKTLCPICFECKIKMDLHPLAMRLDGSIMFWSDVCVNCFVAERRFYSPLPKHYLTHSSQYQWRINARINKVYIRTPNYHPKHERL